MTLAYFIGAVGVELATTPPVRFASEGEGIVWYELKRRRIEFVYQWAPNGGDNPFTPGREERSADFAIPALRLVIQVNDPFTHTDPLDDQLAAQLFLAYGYETYEVWTAEIHPDQGGDVVAALDKIPGLKFFGQIPRRPTAFDKGGKLLIFKQPPRIQPFGNFGGF